MVHRKSKIIEKSTPVVSTIVRKLSAP